MQLWKALHWCSSCKAQTHQSHDVTHVTLFLAFNNTFMREENGSHTLRMVWASKRITLSTHFKLFSHYFPKETGSSIEYFPVSITLKLIVKWHSIDFFVFGQSLLMTDATLAGMSPSRMSLHFSQNLAVLSDPLNIPGSHTHTHTHIHACTHTLVCTALDTGGAVFHDRRVLVFMLVGAVFQRAGAL